MNERQILNKTRAKRERENEGDCNKRMKKSGFLEFPEREIK
jgi:hypothetical protein